LAKIWISGMRCYRHLNRESDGGARPEPVALFGADSGMLEPVNATVATLTRPARDNKSTLQEQLDP
jgi:hypothetical protein